MNLYFMVGIPSSGKTTWAHQNLPGCVIVSNDDIREELFGDPADPYHLERVLKVAHNRVIRALKAGRDVVYDTTNISPRIRSLLLRRVRAERLDVRVTAIVMEVAPEEAIAMQAGRARQVPHRTIRHFHRVFVVPRREEGFAEIRHIRPLTGFSPVRVQGTDRRVPRVLLRPEATRNATQP